MNLHNETINLSKTNQKINKRQEQELDYTYVSDRVPKPFVQLVKCYFPEAKTIEEYWHMTEIAAWRGNREKEPDTVLETAIGAFKQMIRKLKLTRSVKNPVAYYYGILGQKFYYIYLGELREMGFGCNGPLTAKYTFDGETFEMEYKEHIYSF